MIGLCPHSLFLSFSLSQAHTHALSLNFFRRSILTLHIFNSQALSRITRTSEWARENEKEKNGRVSEWESLYVHCGAIVERAFIVGLRATESNEDLF